jgi:endoglucanase
MFHSAASRRLLIFVIALASTLTPLISPSAAQTTLQAAYIRVNQSGYGAQSSKRAYLMSSQDASAARFAVRNASGKNIYTASVGPDLGSWSTAFPHVYPLDFDSVSAAGSYRIAVAGPVAATSPVFAVDSYANLYATPLVNSLYFYQNQRDGADYIPTALRSAPGHLNDADAAVYFTPKFNQNDGFPGDLKPVGLNIDGSGGWADAGDYLKFVETHSYTVALMLTGARDFPDQMGASAGASSFNDEARFGLDWLQKMWDNANQVLYYQVGIAEGNSHIIGDHDLWRLPQDDDAYGGTDPQYKYIRNRPVLRAAAPGSLVSPNLAGRLAADFALCFQTFKVSDPAYADQCIASAEAIFDLANPNPQGNLLTAGPFDFYPEVEWRDDLELGAAELYFAVQSGDLPPGLPHTNPNFYLKAAAHWAYAYIHGPNDATDTLNLYDVSGLAHYELYRAISLAGNPPGLAVSQADLLSDIAQQLNDAVTQAGMDPFGFGYPWAAYDTTTHGAGLSVMASEYDYLTGMTAYSDQSVRWVANILGANAWGTSLVVGDGTVFPDCMQHQVANLAGSLDGSDPVLAGAVVEGPNTFAATGIVDGMRKCPVNGGDRFAPFNSSTAVYQDNVQSYSTVEPAIDLGASTPLAFSWLITGGPSVVP